jgi:UDP-glucose 4-epimerase
MKILVTGGTGFIGSHTTVELLQKGYDVVIADNLSNSEEWIVDRIEEIAGNRPYFEKIDCCNLSDLKKLFLLHSDIKAVIHFAAFKAVGESVAAPLSYYRNNLVSLINLLDCMKETKISNLVFSSSCTVYGEPQYLPVDENHPVQKAESPYGNTKQIGEEIIMDASLGGNLNGICLRYFNPIGAHPTAKIGELPQGVPNNLVPFITQTAIGKRKELKVFGNDYPTPDGSCIRDYIHVVDLAKAHVVAVERLLKAKNKSRFEVFNLGTGNGASVLEVVNAFEKVSGEKLNYSIAPRRPGDVIKVYADTTFANQELGWKTELSLEEALLSAWKWEKHLNQKK